MKRIAILWLAIIFCGSILAQTTKTPVDTIVNLSGKKLPCKVLSVSSSTILYSLPGKKESLAVERKEVEKIIYRNGNVEKFNKPVLTMVEEGQWESILVTREAKDVQGLYDRGTITAKSSPSSRNKKAALQSAVIKLQKKAANLQGSMVLITKTDFYGGYDENPGYELQATVYGKEPLEKGTDVVNDKDKTKESTKK
ncbi:MAG TPA: hypothetical protein VHO90_21725 [Bacteroidales bacterium]|jgi:hypothetical protein|nr:hypothetical protein [Bacteroidales bacterium]